jgi:hypothetical protein
MLVLTGLAMRGPLPGAGFALVLRRLEAFGLGDVNQHGLDGMPAYAR